MSQIKKLGVFSFAKFKALIGALIGLLCGMLYSFGGLIIDLLVTIGWMTSAETPGLSYGTLLAFGALVGMPLIGIIAGFLLGLLEAMVYNRFAKWVGGLNVNFVLQE